MRKINLSISVPPSRSVWSALAFVMLALFAIWQTHGFLIDGFVEIFSWDETTPNGTILEQLPTLIWVPIISYLIIGGGVCLFVNILKPLKGFDGNGLVNGLVFGLADEFEAFETATETPTDPAMH